MRRKIFISINIPPGVKKRLMRAAEKWKDLPVKWVKEDNLHVTLSFLGYVEDETLGDICEKVARASEQKEMFDMEFDRITLAPENDPRMIWLSGIDSPELKKLHEDIEKELGMFTVEKKTFSPHITIGRIRKHRWQSLLEKPEIDERFHLVIPVESVDVMASHFNNTGQEYTLIEDCPLR